MGRIVNQIIWDVKSVPAWLIQDYLVELGGQIEGEGRVSGPGWRANYYRIDDFKVGSISVGCVRLELSGDEHALEDMMPRLELKLMRGGG